MQNNQAKIYETFILENGPKKVVFIQKVKGKNPVHCKKSNWHKECLVQTGFTVNGDFNFSW